jgi:hypothetical protein
MAQRIQADPPQLPGGRVAEMASGVAVRRFVQGNGKNDRQAAMAMVWIRLSSIACSQSRPNRASEPRPGGSTPVRAGQIDNGRRLGTAMAGVEDQFQLIFQTILNLPTFSQRKLRRPAVAASWSIAAHSTLRAAPAPPGDWVCADQLFCAWGATNGAAVPWCLRG